MKKVRLFAVGVIIILIGYVGWYHSSIHPGEFFDFDGESPSGLTGAVSNALSIPEHTYIVASNTPQFVVLSFDGSKSLQMLNETLAFEKEMVAINKPLHFTYFINAAYFLTQANAGLYQPPGRHPNGSSNIGFSDSASDISKRVKAFNDAVNSGNEIASHAVGHFNGSNWTAEEWKQEFSSFNTILFNAQKNNLPEKIEPWVISSQQIIGFRAPNLGVDPNLYQNLRDFHFLYDSSGVGNPRNWPKKDSYGIWHIPLGEIRIGLRRSPAAAMDYSLWIHQSRGKNTVTKGSDGWNMDFDEIEKSYMQYFDANYIGSRAPVIIANHFSKWNDGLYWEAMKKFAHNVCGKPLVRCVSFKELVAYLNTEGIPQTISAQ